MTTWNRTGTVAVTNGSPTVTGSGVSWSNVQPGDAFHGPDGEIYEVSSVTGSTITLVENYGGSTASGASYAIQPTRGVLVPLRQQLADLIAQANSILADEPLRAANNLSDLTNAATARTNLGVPLNNIAITGGTVNGAAIGGTTPAAAGFTTLSASGDVSIADKIVHTGDTDTAIRFPAADTVTVETAGSERMRIDSSGNVGIGTSFPQSDLEVQSKTTGTDAVISLTAAGVRRYQIKALTSAGALAFVDESLASERMRIDSSGNVGIGTSSPSERLSVTGNVTISGSLSKGSGSFKIDHPIKPDTHHLVHSFIEGPQADNLYRGRVNLVAGRAIVNLDEAGRMTDGTFVALNGNVQCFTTNETGWTAVRGSVSKNVLTIEAQDPVCTDEVSWLVIGERRDPHMMEANWTDANGRIITEPQKPSSMKSEAE